MAECFKKKKDTQTDRNFEKDRGRESETDIEWKMQTIRSESDRESNNYLVMIANHFADEKLEHESDDDEDDAAGGDLSWGSVLRPEVVRVDRVPRGASPIVEVLVFLIRTEIEETSPILKSKMVFQKLWVGNPTSYFERFSEGGLLYTSPPRGPPLMFFYVRVNKKIIEVLLVTLGSTKLKDRNINIVRTEVENGLKTRLVLKFRCA